MPALTDTEIVAVHERFCISMHTIRRHAIGSIVIEEVLGPNGERLRDCMPPPIWVTRTLRCQH